MARFLAACLATVCIVLLSPPLTSCEAKHDTVDAFKIFENFPSAVALYDIDQDGDLDCMTAERTELSNNPRHATYILSLKGLNGHQARNITFHITPGPTPDIKLFTVNEDYDHELQGRFIYTDYVNCAIDEFPIDNRQECILWVNTEVKDNVPQSCLDQFQENCENGVLAYDEDSCGQLLQ
ncbi:uncharacterized protein LOC144125558 [Amblyomma americanum]